MKTFTKFLLNTTCIGLIGILATPIYAGDPNISHQELLDIFENSNKFQVGNESYDKDYFQSLGFQLVQDKYNEKKYIHWKNLRLKKDSNLPIGILSAEFVKTGTTMVQYSEPVITGIPGVNDLWPSSIQDASNIQVVLQILFKDRNFVQRQAILNNLLQQEILKKDDANKIYSVALKPEMSISYTDFNIIMLQDQDLSHINFGITTTPGGSVPVINTADLQNMILTFVGQPSTSTTLDISRFPDAVKQQIWKLLNLPESPTTISFNGLTPEQLAQLLKIISSSPEINAILAIQQAGIDLSQLPEGRWCEVGRIYCKKTVNGIEIVLATPKNGLKKVSEKAANLLDKAQ